MVFYGIVEKGTENTKVAKSLNLVLVNISIGYTPRARLLNHWATKPEVLVL